STTDPLATGKEALERGDWAEAREAFRTSADAEGTPEAFEGLGLAAWFIDDAETMFPAREEAYRLYCEGNRRQDAGRLATWLAWDNLTFRGERAVSAGWYARAHRQLDDLDPVPEQGWLALRESSMLLPGDAQGAREMSAAAAELGRSLGDVDLEM